ncbi:hypothetical protein HC928_21330 [bacterium]|nr:hypothetical protein [bacterium]
MLSSLNFCEEDVLEYGFQDSEAVRGDDLSIGLSLSLQEAALGAEKEIKCSCLVVCRNCQGKGYQISARFSLNPHSEKCNLCGGEKRIIKTKILRISVPPGVASGVRLRVRGEGDAGKNGGDSGNLYITLSVSDREAIDNLA